jgi:hypothetical protein
MAVPVTERMKLPPARKDHLAIPSVESGVKGYLQRMRQYPTLTSEQTALALAVLHSGGSMETLRALSSFSSPVKEKQDSFNLLFATCTGLEMVIAYGNFPLIRKWGMQYAKAYPNLAPFPLEEYFQDALWKHVPESVRAYMPDRGTVFKTWVSNKLIWELEHLVNQRYKDLYSTPPGYHPFKEGFRPKNDPQRRALLSLDRAVPDPESDEGALTFAATIVDPQANTEGEALQDVSNIRLLYQLARLTGRQEEVVTALFVNGEEPGELAERLHLTDRAIRSRREKALGALRTLSLPTIQGVLSGDSDEVLTSA